MAQRDAGDDLAAHLARWAAEAAQRDSAAGRERQRWLRQQAAESATLAGTLVDLSERGTTVTVTTRSHHHAGRIDAVGRDFCILSPVTVSAGRSGTPLGATVVRLAALVAVRPQPTAGPAPAGGNRPPALALDLAGALELLAGERHPVALSTASGEVIRGTLEAVGTDIATLVADGTPRRHVTVALWAIEACTLL